MNNLEKILADGAIDLDKWRHDIRGTISFIDNMVNLMEKSNLTDSVQETVQKSATLRKKSLDEMYLSLLKLQQMSDEDV